MDIIFKPSPNFVKGRSGYQPIAIVIHVMQGTLLGTDSWFADPKSEVSAHYGIGKNGEVHRYVLEIDTAWHAGRVYEPTWKLLKTADNGEVVNPNSYTIGIEHEGTEDTDWTDDMYAASSAIIAEIAQRWDIPLDRGHIIGHHEIYALKTCPGNKVDLDKLIMLAAQSKQVTPVLLTYAATTQTAVKTVTNLNIRKTPDTTLERITEVDSGTVLKYVGFTNNGENVSGCPKWYLTSDGNWFWSGATVTV
jgi:N-acetylmuramoyl-L-alanine amidase